MKKFLPYVFGLLIGIVNGFFGAAGGVVAVELLKKDGVDSKKAHATSIAIILAVSAVTLVLYYLNGQINLLSSYKYIAGGFLGAVFGVLLLKRIPNKLLKRVFGILIIICGIRMLFK